MTARKLKLYLLFHPTVIFHNLVMVLQRPWTFRRFLRWLFRYYYFYYSADAADLTTGTRNKLGNTRRLLHKSDAIVKRVSIYNIYGSINMRTGQSRNRTVRPFVVNRRTHDGISLTNDIGYCYVRATAGCIACH